MQNQLPFATIYYEVHIIQNVFLVIFCVSDVAAEKIEVDLELVLEVDASRSVDAREHKHQLFGIAAAFNDPGFLRVLRYASPKGIVATLVEWSDVSQERQLINWTHIKDQRSSEAFAQSVLRSQRTTIPGKTAIGSAIINCSRLMINNKFSGRRRVIDITGDGFNNSCMPPEHARDVVLNKEKLISINALTINADNPQLDRYFSSRVIGGPGAFVMVARTFDDFARAFKMKLLREVGGADFVLKIVEPTFRPERRHWDE